MWLPLNLWLPSLQAQITNQIPNLLAVSPAQNYDLRDAAYLEPSMPWVAHRRNKEFGAGLDW